MLIDEQDKKLFADKNIKISGFGYAFYYENKKAHYIHKILLGNPKAIVDHINGNKLDNRRSNLRVVSRADNRANSKPQRNKSGYRGVYWRSDRGKWIARIHEGKNYLYIGSYGDVKEAALAWNDKAKELYGKYTFQNEVAR